MITRRSLLGGILAACVAPAFVRNPMKVRPSGLLVPDGDVVYGTSVIQEVLDHIAEMHSLGPEVGLIDHRLDAVRYAVETESGLNKLMLDSLVGTRIALFAGNIGDPTRKLAELTIQLDGSLSGRRIRSGLVQSAFVQDGPFIGARVKL